MCTSIVIKAEDGSPIYGRTMEWGGMDLRPSLLMVPRGTSFTSILSNGKPGKSWQGKYGYVSINPEGIPHACSDGMNETGLIIGVLVLSDFTKYQDFVAGKEPNTITNTDVPDYILSQFSDVEEIRAALPLLRVVYNDAAEKQFEAPVCFHWVVADNKGQSLVIEYSDGELQLYDNKIGVLTNSPQYDWHLLNLRNYSNLHAKNVPNDLEINGVSLKPFGVGSGMHGLPGDITPPSRFIRATAFTQTQLPFPDAVAGVCEAVRIMHNFDIPRGLVFEGTKDGVPFVAHTQFTIIGDIRNKRYHYWTEFNNRIRVVDLTKLDFSGPKTLSIPLDAERVEDTEDISAALLA